MPSWSARTRRGLGCTPRPSQRLHRQCFELAEYNGFGAMPSWIDPFVGTPEERMAKLKRPGVRDRMRADVGAWGGQGGTGDIASGLE